MSSPATPPPPPHSPRIAPLGDRALIITLGDSLDDATREQVRDVAARVTDAMNAAISDIVPGFTTVTVHYDPAVVARRDGLLPHVVMRNALEEILRRGGATTAAPIRTVEIPVQYGGARGPDLEHVAARARLTADEVVALHIAREYVVHMIGFLPGFPYLGGLDERIATPRRAEPRVKVPKGSVGIGGAQTGVYPVDSPGGWQLIGWTPAVLFDATRDEPSLLRAGDRVRFVAADANGVAR